MRGNAELPAAEAPRGTLVPLAVAAAGIVAWLASGLASSPWSFLPDPELVPDLLWLALLGALLVRPGAPAVPLAVGLLLLAQVGLAATLLATLGPHLLFTDDHSTFLYRLHVLQQRFPDIASYNTGWNAGILTNDLFATGAVLLYLLASPLLAVAPVERVYNVAIAALVVGLLPWLLYAAARVLGLGRRTAVATAFFGLAPSLLLCRWALKYGTTPFAVVSFLSPLTYALARATVLAATGWIRFAAPLGGALALSMFWSGSAFLLAPVGAAALLERSPSGWLRGAARLAAVAAVVLAASAWWLVDYFRIVPVAAFLQQGTTTGAPPPEPHPFTFAVTLRTLWSVLQMTNPFLLALFPAAIAAGVRRPVVARLGGLALAFLLLATVGPQLARHLELDRMALPMSLFLAPAAALGLRELWKTAGPAGALARGLVVAALALTALAARGYLANESVERFARLDPAVEELVRRIRADGRGGRTYVAGFVLHDFSGGHAAALQHLAGVPMIAVDPMHRFWWYRDPLPLAFRRTHEGFRRYLALHNVDLVVTKDPEWRERVSADPAFEPLWSDGRYALYRFREFPGSWLFEGEADVDGRDGRLRVRLRTPEAVLRYRHLPGLAARPAGEVRPVPVDGLDWVGIAAPVGRWVEILRP